MWMKIDFASRPAVAMRTVATDTAAQPRRTRRSVFRTASSALLFVVLASALPLACNGPCEDLANKICDCEANSTAKDACLEQVRSAMQNRTVTDDENNACDAVVDGCTCEK